MRATSIIAVVLLAMILVNAIVVESGIVAIAIAVIAGGVLGGLVGYHIGRQQQQAAIHFEAYRNRQITVTAYVSQISQIMVSEFAAFQNNTIIMNSSYFNHFANYYRQWADHIACSVCAPGSTTIPNPNETLTELARDLANIVRSEIESVISLLSERVRTALNLIELLKLEGVPRTSGTLTIVYSGTSLTGTRSYYQVNITQNPWLWVGEIIESNNPVLMLCMGTTCSPLRYQILLGNMIVGYYYWWNGTYEINTTLLLDYVRSETPRQLALRADSGMAPVNPPTFTLGLTDAAPRIYRIARLQYITYCQAVQTLPQSPVCYPPPSVVLPMDINKLMSMPPEVQLQIYMAYLNQLATANWTQVREIAPQTVYIAVGAARIYGILNNTLVEVSPVTVPFRLKAIVGRPMPLVGTWVVNGTLRTYAALTLTPDMTYARIESTPYYYIYQAGNTVGIGVDLNNDDVPDVYSNHYLSNVTRILDYDTETWTYVEKTEADIGMSARDYQRLQGAQNYPAGIPLPDIFSIRISRSTLIIAAAAAVVIILLLALASGGKTVVVAR